jgi:predicted ATPase
MVPTYLTALARSYARTRQLDRASEIISQALETVDETNERTSEAETHRKAGELALLSAPPDVERAEASFQCGLAIARQQGARSFELRTATSLARLWRDQGKSADARNLLAPIYGWFTEGFDLPDLKDAKAQLDEVSGSSYL